MNKNNISYIDNGVKSSGCLIFLHGWGNNKQLMFPLAEKFKDVRTICVDLPGFGQSDLASNRTVYDYADEIYAFVKKHSLKNVILVGHSFGGKVAMVYASKYDVDKLVVLGAPYKKTHIGFFKKIFYSLSKMIKVNFLRDIYIKLFGSEDYKNSNRKLREVMKSTVSTDISLDIKRIKCPTLLIWGKLDEAVSLGDAYEINSMIEDSAVIEIDQGTHYAYLEQTEYIYNIINTFIEIGDLDDN